MNKFFYSLSLLLFFFLCEELRADTVITEIRTEQLVAPVGIDAPAPRLSWQITSTERIVMQTGYHIRRCKSTFHFWCYTTIHFSLHH